MKSKEAKTSGRRRDNLECLDLLFECIRMRFKKNSKHIPDSIFRLESKSEVGLVIRINFGSDFFGFLK